MTFTFILVLIGWIFSLCLHEWAHARVAYEGGDLSVEKNGYLSFNPLKYMDPFFSIIVPLIFLMLGGLGLPGGAVYIDESRLGQGRPQGGGWPPGQNARPQKLFGLFNISAQSISNAQWSTMVSLAGPLSNLVLAIVIGLVLRFVPPPIDGGGPALAFIGVLQIMAVLFNLIPIPHLDGYHAIRPYLDRGTRAALDGAGMFGIIILFMMFNNIESLNDSFWTLVFRISAFLGIDPALAIMGQEQFMFWK